MRLKSLQLWPSVAEEMNRKLTRRVLLNIATPGRSWVGEEAAEVLHSVLELIEDFADKLARPIDPYGWLWYSRRLHPSIFRGELQTTAPVDWLIFEMMGARSRRSGPYRDEDDRGLYPSDDESLRQVLRLAALAVHYSETAGTLRRAGKGATVASHLDHLPSSVPDPDLEFYIQLFDQRAAEDIGFSGGTKMLADLTPSSSGGGLLVVARTYDLQEVPGWTGKLSDGNMLSMEGSFVPFLRSLDALEEIFGNTGVGVAVEDWWHPSLPALVVLLRSLTLHVFTVSKVAGMTLPKVGYLVASPPYVEAVLDACLPAASEGLANLFPSSALPSSGAEVLAQVQHWEPCLTPLLPGPVFRQAGNNNLVVDLHASTQALDRMLTIPSRLGGDVVNRRAAHFEVVTQDEVDRIPCWKPPAELRHYRGRQLKLNKKWVTDIDALAAHDDTLLLIDCKSIPYTPEYDAGEYSAVRNVRTNLDAYVKSWLQVRDLFRQNPVGDNYDFSRFSNIDAVVCTPHVFYLTTPETLEEISLGKDITLRRACSIRELVRALTALS